MRKSMPNRSVTLETLESRTLLSAAAGPHAAPPSGDQAAVYASAKPKHVAAPASILPTSGSFSNTYDGYTFSGTVNGTTHALNATLTGKGVDFKVTGTYNATTKAVNLTVTGSNINLTIVGSLSGNTVTGSVNGSVYGFSVSVNNGTFTV